MTILRDADETVAHAPAVASSLAETDRPRVFGRQQLISTPDHVQISVREWGNPDGPEILFIHGVAQCHLSFARQMTSSLARSFRLVAYDLRGHGESAKPLDPVLYRDGRRWADEVAAVIDAKRLRRPVLVGWSLGGRVLRQYLVHYGDRHIAGINIVSARPLEDPSVLGPGSLADLAGQPIDLDERIRAGAAFLRACFHRQPSEADFAFALAYNMIVPREVREAIAGWSTDIDLVRAAFGKLVVPALISHGLADRLVLPAAAGLTAAAIPRARLSWYEDCGHSPFFEDADRFNRELAAFVMAAGAQAGDLPAEPNGHRG
jgi:non-heme chloroperoxidase